MRIVLMGTPEFGVPTLQQLVLNDYSVVAVYTQPDRSAGRGCHMTQPPIKKEALKLNLPVLQPASLKKADIVTELVDLKPDVIVVVAYGQILPEEVLEIPEYGCINIHPSLLPKHRGASPVASSILTGDEFTGISVMIMDKGLDTGPVLAKAQIPISDIDSTGSLSLKLSIVAAHLLQDVLPDWKRGLLESHSQVKEKATYSGIITKESGEIVWHQSADFIWRQIRAFHPWPGCYTNWQGKRLRIIKAMPLTEDSDTTEGQVVALAQGGFGIKTGSGILKILVVQVEGKRAMTADEFLRGHRHLIDSMLPS